LQDTVLRARGLWLAVSALALPDETPRISLERIQDSAEQVLEPCLPEAEDGQ
jgi:hypothetical protein